ncbi:NAD-P-binding protein [Mycena epipterygia]|nr:NAD-P-binding protein [Mycena epipterygia]
MNPTTKKLILVLGATGAQGQAVIYALLSPGPSGQSSPYSVRALTRDLRSKQALDLIAHGVECVEGSFENFEAVAKALDGAYGVWVNTDGFTVGDVREIYAGMRIFELASRTASLRHYVWSNLPGASKNTGYNPEYKVQHMDAKGRIADWLLAQPSVISDATLSWSIVTTGPYMDMLKGGLFSPLNVRKDGTVVFAAPIEGGQVPMITLKDLGWWARWAFDHRAETSGRDVNVASDRVGWAYLVKTFTKVTGKPAVFKRQTIDEWWLNFDAEKLDNPVASDRKKGDGSSTVRQNFSAVWRVLRDDVIKKDMEWVRSVHPTGDTLEQWMRENRYEGMAKPVLKNVLDGTNPWGVNAEVRASL